LVNRLGLGGVEPGKPLGLAEGKELEEWAGKVGAKDLGEVGGGAVLVRRFIPQPEADAGAGAPRPAGPLVGRGPRDRDQLEPRQARRARDAHLTDHPGVDDRTDAGNRQTGLSDVRRQDDLPSAGLLENAVLLLRGQFAMEDDDRVPLPVGEGVDCVGRPHDLADSREEHEHVASRVFQRLPDRVCHLIDELALIAASAIPHLHRMEATRRRHHRAARGSPRGEDPGHRAGVEGGAHDNDAEVGAERLPDAEEHPKDEIHLHRPLMKLIEDDAGYSLERDVLEEAPEHDPGRLDDQSGVAAHAAVEAHLIADLAAEVTAAELGDLRGDRPGREPARLHEDQPRARREIVKHRRRYEHRLPGAGGSRDDDRSPLPCRARSARP
jgi:hypothetical protein